VRLDAAGQPRLIERPLPSVITRALQDAGGEPIVRADLGARLVRRPELRELVSALDELDALCVVPLLVHAELEGALVVARGARRDAITLEELAALAGVASFVAPLSAQFLGAERARLRADEAGAERDGLRDRLEEARELLAEARAEANLLKAGHRVPSGPQVTYSEVMRELNERLTAVAPQETPVLFVREQGTSLLPLVELLQRAGGRDGKPLVVGDCSALDPEQQAAALFGSREAGNPRPGWLELAGEGVLLLDDVVALSTEVQQVLAEALADRRARPLGGQGAYVVQARLVVGVHQPLAALSSVGALAPELARWLEHTTYRVPPLRERREDLESLVLIALDRAARVLGREVPGLAPEAREALLDYDYPGNAVELESILERAVARSTGPRVTLEDLPPLPAGAASAGSFLDQEREILRRALERAGGNKTRAARALGLKRTTLIDKLRRLGLEEPAPRGTEH
jgi:DNA-binding NtrC family response regulator